MTEREPELTLRGIALGAAITLLFTAANVYLGLKIGLTFATSIPAAVISMALLRLVRNAGILENNIVQTVASAAGTLSGVIFVVPGLIMVGWWQGFPFGQTFAICACGGLLGVMFSIPLRRALVTGSDLPYPEGVAAAEVLKVGVGSREGEAEGRAGLRVLAAGSLVAAGYAALAAAKLFAAEAAAWVRLALPGGSAAVGSSFGFAFALVGAGHLCGLSVGMAMFAGWAIAFLIATPLLTWLHATPGAAADAAQGTWAHDVRFIGAGVIGVAALWALARLILPIVEGLRSAAAASRARKAGGGVLAIEEQDIPIGIMGLIVLVLLVPIAALLYGFLAGGPLDGQALPLVLGGLVFVLLVSAFVAAVCGYMAGLIGASNSPLSGVGILAILAAALILAPLATPETRKPLVAFALFVTAVVFAAATISNDNLQDLKTGQLVGATPWRQQVALMAGVIAGSLAIPPVLDLLGHAYGFAGAPGADPARALPAPQATLIAALAKGVIAGGFDWSLLGIGAALAAVLIAADGLLGRAGWLRLPPLSVGIGIYLPGSATLGVTIGAIAGWLFDRRHKDEGVRRMGVLLASGFIVGDGLFGVLNAGLIVGLGPDPLALVGDDFARGATILGAIAFFAAIVALYRWTGRALRC